MKKQPLGKLRKRYEKYLLSFDCIAHFATYDGAQSIAIMDKNGAGFLRMSWYYTDDKAILLDSLFVEKHAREKGLASLLMQMCEVICRDMEADKVCLCVLKDSWMESWYARLGYQQINFQLDPNYIWMQKNISKQIQPW